MTTEPDDHEAIEHVADNLHYAWMHAKVAQGITSRLAEDGEELMVPYPSLSDKQRGVDRACASQAVRTLRAIGWRPPVHERPEEHRRVAAAGMMPKPCPFCGGVPTIQKTSNGYFLECTHDNCGSRGVFEHVLHAVANWNRRSDLVADKLRQALAQIEISTSTIGGDSFPDEARDAANAIARSALENP